MLVAEVLKHFVPSIVDLHNYTNTNSAQMKTSNWTTLNQKVMKKLNINLSPKDIKDVVDMVPESVERILFTLRIKIE